MDAKEELVTVIKSGHEVLRPLELVCWKNLEDLEKGV